MITINQCRIDPTRTRLEFNLESYANADGYYKFTHLYVWLPGENYFVVTNNSRDIAPLVFDGTNSTEIKTVDLTNLPLTYSFLSTNTMFYFLFMVEWVGENEPETVGGVTITDEEKQAKAVVADLHQSYYTKVRLLQDLRSETMNTERVIQLYMYENCFKSAVALERWEDADYYYSNLQGLINNSLIVTFT